MCDVVQHQPCDSQGLERVVLRRLFDAFEAIVLVVKLKRYEGLEAAVSSCNSRSRIM